VTLRKRPRVGDEGNGGASGLVSKTAREHLPEGAVSGPIVRPEICARIGSRGEWAT